MRQAHRDIKRISEEVAAARGACGRPGDDRIDRSDAMNRADRGDGIDVVGCFAQNAGDF